jgi:hypothetical protein
LGAAWCSRSLFDRPVGIGSSLPNAIVEDLQKDQPAGTPHRGSFSRHPIHATVEEAEHLREVADEGESPATPAIVAGVVFTFILPLATFLILLAFVVMHFA